MHITVGSFGLKDQGRDYSSCAVKFVPKFTILNSIQVGGSETEGHMPGTRTSFWIRLWEWRRCWD